MNALRPALIGIIAGAIVYAGLAGFLRPKGGQEALIGDIVTELVSPEVSLATNPINGDRISDTIDDSGLSPVMSPDPLVAPTVSTVVTPRISIPVQASQSVLPKPPTQTPTPQITPRVTTPTPTSTPTPEATTTPTPTPLPEPSLVVINEIAWAGTATSSADEWIELFNAGESAVDLTGWTLYEGEAPIIQFSTFGTNRVLVNGIIEPGQYYIIERSDDEVISDIGADLYGPFSGSGLRNSPGEDLQLRDASGFVADRVNCASTAWFSGSASPNYASMERISSAGEGSDPANWAANDGLVTTGLDAGGQPIRGTPKYRNSVAQ